MVIVYCNFLVIVKNNANTNAFFTVIRPSQFLTQRTAEDGITSATHRASSKHVFGLIGVWSAAVETIETMFFLGDGS